MSFSKPALRNTFYTGDLDIIGKTETLTTDLYVPATSLHVLDSMGHQLPLGAYSFLYTFPLCLSSQTKN